MRLRQSPIHSTKPNERPSLAAKAIANDAAKVLAVVVLMAEVLSSEEVGATFKQGDKVISDDLQKDHSLLQTPDPQG